MRRIRNFDGIVDKKCNFGGPKHHRGCEERKRKRKLNGSVAGLCMKTSSRCEKADFTQASKV
jgi:hypothetical protein